MRDKVYFYSCIEFAEAETAENITVHCGMHTAASREQVLEDIAGNFIDPRYISIKEVRELAPTYDGNGDPVGYMAAPGAFSQADTQPVNNGEVAHDE